ncbi:MAG: DUF7524 family protein [Halobacteriota archaeon]
MARLSVDLSSEQLHDVSAPTSFRSTGSFAIDLLNHSEAVHVHLHVDESLSRAVELLTNNHFLDANETKTIEVDTKPIDREVSGRLKIVSAHGAETEYVNVTVEPPERDADRVAVDEKLARPKPKPQPDPSAVDVLSRRFGGVSPVVIGFALLSVLLALAIGVSIGGGIVVLGALVVVIGTIGALAIASSW